MDDLYRDRRDQVHGVLRRAVDRCEIVPEVISEDIWDVLPGSACCSTAVPSGDP